jgi:drug/metabolite transporter (DMT)-like permease
VYLAFLALAVGPQLLGHTSFNYGLRYLSAAYISVALLGEPIGSTILALLLLKEIPTTLEVVGGIVILAGIYLASRAPDRPA